MRSVVLLAFLCSCANPATHEYEEAFSVHDIFAGHGGIELNYAPGMPEAVLVIARDANELTAIIAAVSGTWTIESHSLRLAPLQRSGDLGIWDHRRAAVPDRPRWLPPEDLPGDCFLVNEMIAGESSRMWLVGLAHKDNALLKKLRIRSLRIVEKTCLRVDTEGSVDVEPADVEVGECHVHITSAVAHHGAGLAWPECVAVFTNGERGFPRLPLRIRLGDRDLEDRERVLRSK